MKNKIQNVVFLGGDIHCSNVAEIEFEDDAAKELQGLLVTSSAFYWPFPSPTAIRTAMSTTCARPEQNDPFPIVGTDAVMHYRSYGYTQEDNFSRIDIDRATTTLTVRVFDAGRADLGRPGRRDTEKGIVLQLAKW